MRQRHSILRLAVRIALRLAGVALAVMAAWLGWHFGCTRSGAFAAAAAILALPAGCLLASFVACLVVYLLNRTIEDIRAVRAYRTEEPYDRER